MEKKSFHKKLFIALYLACIIGSWSVYPYSYALGAIPAEAPFWQVFFYGTLANALLYAFACFLSYKLLPKTDLEPFKVKNATQQVIIPSAVGGVAIGFVIFLLDRFMFGSSALSGVHPPAWTGVIASIYGAVNEEVLLRLFLFTLIYFLFGKLFKLRKGNRLSFLWITNAIVALLFGIGHFPAAAMNVSTSAFEFTRILLLNGIAGIVFGWLYWSRGLWAAMGAHFVADLMLHVFFI